MTLAHPKEDVWVKTFCHGCLSATCGMLVHRVDGVVVGLQGDPDNPFNKGKLCAKAYAHIMTLYDPYRPLQPLVRTNPEKGIGVDPAWKEVSWEEALDLVSRKLAEVRRTNPADLCLSSADISAITWMPVPIVGSFGTPNWTNTAGYYCAAAVHTVPYATIGAFHMYPDFEYCNYLVLWGSNKGGGMQHTFTTAAADVAEARIDRRMKVVCIDPVQSNIAAKAEEWVPILPGTDLAMALAWLHVLLNDGTYDVEHLKRYTNAPYLVRPDGHYFREPVGNKPVMWDPVAEEARPYDTDFPDVAIEGTYQVQGISCRPVFDLLKAHVKDYTPAWAAPITTVPAATIRRLAREFGQAARIGSTMMYEGHSLPYRPAAIHWYAGISQHVNGYVTGMALQLINTIVGNLLTPGGIVGEGVIMEFPLGTATKWTGRGAVPGEMDGLFCASPYTRFGGGVAAGYPPAKVEIPRTATGQELFPVGMGGGRAIFEINNLNPERFNHKVPRPKVLLTRHGSDMTNRGNPTEQARNLKQFFQISCEPIVDETAEFADILLPVPTRLERLQLGSELPGYAGATLNLQHYCINLSQPVVPPIGREMLDIWGEIADRLEIRAEFNQLVNIAWGLEGEHRLNPEEKYTYEEMQERFCKTLFGAELDLEGLGRRGHVKWRKNVKERYPRTFLDQRTPIYYEHFIDAGKQLADLARELHFAWDTEDFRPLPTWRPGISMREGGPGFDLLAIPFRVPFITHMWQTHNPWLAEMGEAHPWAFKIVLNAITATRLGIRDGDQIEVETLKGYKVEGKARLTHCIHPEVVALSRHGGHWAAHPIAKGKGTLFNTLVPHTTEYMDPLYGGLEGCYRVRVAKSPYPHIDKSAKPL